MYTDDVLKSSQGQKRDKQPVVAAHDVSLQQHVPCLIHKDSPYQKVQSFSHKEGPMMALVVLVVVAHLSLPALLKASEHSYCEIGKAL